MPRCAHRGRRLRATRCLRPWRVEVQAGRSVGRHQGGRSSNDVLRCRVFHHSRKGGWASWEENQQDRGEGDEQADNSGDDSETLLEVAPKEEARKETADGKQPEELHEEVDQETESGTFNTAERVKVAEEVEHDCGNGDEHVGKDEGKKPFGVLIHGAKGVKKGKESVSSVERGIVIEYGRVAIAEEAEVVGEGLVVYGSRLPIVKGSDKLVVGRLRLVVFGYDGLDDVERLARCDDNLCGGMEGGETLLREVVEHCSQGFECGELPGGLGIFVGHPLRHMKFFGAQFAPFGLGAVQQHPDIVKALKRPDTGGAYSDAMPPMGHQSLNEGARHGNPLGVHRVAGDVFAFHRFERSGSDVEGQFVQFDAFVLQGLEDRRCEVQSGSGSSHRTFDFGVDRLITFKVSGLGAAIEVGGYGNLPKRSELQSRCRSRQCVPR